MGGRVAIGRRKKKGSYNFLSIYVSDKKSIPDPPASMKASPWPDIFCLKNPYNITIMVLEK